MKLSMKESLLKSPRFICSQPGGTGFGRGTSDITFCVVVLGGGFGCFSGDSGFFGAAMTGAIFRAIGAGASCGGGDGADGWLALLFGASRFDTTNMTMKPPS